MKALATTSTTRLANRVELTPIQFLERAGSAFGGRTAVLTASSKRVTYGELRDRAHRLAAALRKVGVRRGDRVAILAPNGLPLLESHFGVPLAEAVLVALNTRLATPEIEFILQDCGARVLIVERELASIVSPVLPKLRDLETVVTISEISAQSERIDEIDYELFISAEAPIRTPSALTEDDPIAINYTSGTTGHPKGAVYTHRGAYLNALSVAFEARLGPESVYLWTLPMFHCNGWCYAWGTVAAGAKNVIVRRIDPKLVWEKIDQERVTHFCAAPTVLIMLAIDPARRRQERDGQRPKVLTGGAPPSPTTIEEMAGLGIEVVHLYGLTETYGPSLACTWWPEWNELDDTTQAKLRARQGIPPVAVAAVRVVDDGMLDVPADGRSMGELVIRSNTVMACYFGDREATDRAFRGGWFHTGDLGVVHPDGYVELRDRAKDIIVSGGENISTIEVEQVIQRHPAVLEVAVIGVPDALWGEVPKAFVELRPGARLSARTLQSFCQKRLARYKAPKSVEFGGLPRTGTGKIQKYLLREREWAGRERRIN